MGPLRQDTGPTGPTGPADPASSLGLEGPIPTHYSNKEIAILWTESVRLSKESKEIVEKVNQTHLLVVTGFLIMLLMMGALLIDAWNSKNQTQQRFFERLIDLESKLPPSTYVPG